MRTSPSLHLGRIVLAALARTFDRLPMAFYGRATQMVLDAGLCAAALYLAFQLRFDGAVPDEYRVVMWTWVLALAVARPVAMLVLGGYHGIWRYFNLHDAMVLAFTALPPTVFLLVLRYGFERTWWARVPASIIVIEYGVFLALATSLRSLRRATFEVSPHREQRVRALLVGNDATLPAALRHVVSHPELQVVGLLAPEPGLRGRHIGGCAVIDTPEALPRLLAANAAQLVLIADARVDAIGDVVATATEFGVDVRLLPSAGNVIHGEVRVAAQHEPAAFLNGRAAAAHPQAAVVECFRQRVVLITGAGGSIGSELSRQVAGLPATCLVLLDRDENSIFELSNQLREEGVRPGIVPVVGDIRDAALLRQVFSEHHPKIVLHAAAYKHVPVMEQNCCEAVLNNVFGTRAVLDASIAFQAERFLMISTDKAVRPTSVMGASKRVAEMLVQTRAQAPDGGTRCACVRFGNVVGSRGSVVPIFLRQIAEGGPITITDENMTRYFMTIPEAVQLVLQAATLGSRGDVYMLEMGDPVKITALARKLIEMSGLRPDKDIEIRFVGKRPGEKISEQLWGEGAHIQETEFRRVLRVRPESDLLAIASPLEALEQAARGRDEKAVLAALLELPIGFRRAEDARTVVNSHS
ncbi:MAG TPA: nucleoside-diphosphate sugar epimerase/dehydratase [Terriglobales bacterium]|nr:nucleoside-diphosphate sugar epimerase/dehydratase [Terriglobales bacterium]